MSAPSEIAPQSQSAGSSSAQTLAQLAGAIIAGRIRVVDLTVPLEEREIGGLGIHLMRQIMRDFEYQRSNGWNRIRMRRPIPAEEPRG